MGSRSVVSLSRCHVTYQVVREGVTVDFSFRSPLEKKCRVLSIQERKWPHTILYLK